MIDHTDDSTLATFEMKAVDDESMVRYSPRKPGRIPSKHIPEGNDGDNGDDCHDVLVDVGSPPFTQQYNWSLWLHTGIHGWARALFI